MESTLDIVNDGWRSEGEKGEERERNGEGEREREREEARERQGQGERERERDAGSRQRHTWVLSTQGAALGCAWESSETALPTLSAFASA